MRGPDRVAFKFAVGDTRTETNYNTVRMRLERIFARADRFEPRLAGPEEYVTQTRVIPSTHRCGAEENG